MRAAIYARVSVDDRAVSLDAQEAGAREWCDRHGHAVTHSYRDDGVSGAEWDRRPGVLRLRAEALSKPRPFDVVVVRDLDRLGRDAVRLPLLLVDLRDSDVSVVEWSTGRTVELDGMAIALAQLRATLASEERRGIAARTRIALEARARKGLVVGGEVYGYCRVRGPDGVAYAIDEGQATVIREAFAARAEGRSIRAIVADLNRRGVPSPHAGRRGTGTWSPSALHNMLARDRYLGVLRWGTKGEEYRLGTAHRVERTGDAVVVVERPDLAVIDRETWERVRALDTHAPTKTSHGQTRESRHLLTGRAVCHACGGRVEVTRTRSGRVSVPAYLCSWRRNRAACESRWLQPTERLDAIVAEWLTGEVMTDDVLADVLAEVRRAREAPRADDRVEHLREEERALDASTRGLAAIIERAPDVAAVLDRMRAQETRLRAVRAELSALLARETREAPDEVRAWAHLRALRDVVRGSIADARDVLKIVLDGSPVRIEWLGARKGVRLMADADPGRLLDLTAGGAAPDLTRRPSMSPAGVERAPRLVRLDRAA